MGDLSYLSTMVCQISLLSREGISYSQGILPYQGLSFPYPGLSLQGVRDSKAGKYADNIAFVDFPLLGAYS